MNGQPAPERTGLAYLVGILGSLLIVAALVWAMQRYTQPPPLGEDRVAQRRKALADLRAAEATELESYGWVDQAKGVARLPIARPPHHAQSTARSSNQAERDVRPVKVQMRTSGGCWRTLQGLADFAIVQSYLSTAAGKWGIDA